MSAAAAVEAPAPKKGNKKLIIIVVAALLVLVMGGGAAFMLLKKKPVDEDADATDSQAPSKAAAHSPAKNDPAHPPAYVPLDPFTVNLADREAERYAQVAITLELVEAKTAETIKSFMPAVRNNILMVLAHKSSSELLSREGKIKLAGEVQRASSRALGVDVAEPGTEEAAEDEDSHGKGSKNAAKAKKKKKKAPEPELPIRAVHFSNLIVQ